MTIFPTINNHQRVALRIYAQNRLREKEGAYKIWFVDVVDDGGAGEKRRDDDDKGPTH